MTAGRLSTAAMICGVLAIGTCLADWAVPTRSAADIHSEAVRSHVEGEPVDYAARAREAAIAYPLQGTDEPFHGVWVIVLAGAGAAVTAAGASLASDPARRSLCEGLLRGGGVAFSLAFLVVLMDTGSDVFWQRHRALALWLALAFPLLACLAATFASTLVPQPEGTKRDGPA